MVSSGKRAHGVFLRGINLEDELKTTDIFKHLKEGALADLTDMDGTPWIALGRELATTLGVMLGESVNVISPVGEMGPLGMLPKVRQFKVGAVFEIGMFEYDANLTLTSLKAAQEFFGYGSSVSGIQLRLTDVYKAPSVREAISKKLGFPYYVKDWMQMNRNLFSALKLEKFAMFVILILIVLVASFNIVSTLMMSVIEKEREIAILKAIGATNQGIMAVFMIQGLLIGTVGTAIGLVGATVLGHILNTYEIIKLPADVYYLSRLPVKMKAFDFAVVSVSAVVISFLSTVYPSYQAARLNPVEPLRYE
jgi:lipoprotein-releasing system permease protein